MRPFSGINQSDVHPLRQQRFSIKCFDETDFRQIIIQMIAFVIISLAWTGWDHMPPSVLNL